MKIVIGSEKPRIRWIANTRFFFVLAEDQTEVPVMIRVPMEELKDRYRLRLEYIVEDIKKVL